MHELTAQTIQKRTWNGLGLSLVPGLLGTAFVLAAPVSAAQAAEPEAKSKDHQAYVDEITVTASRIQRPGFVAPTPTTVLTEEDLRLSGRTDIGQVINDLPMARGSFNPISTNLQTKVAGTSTADLRVGALVLIDGRRPIPFDSSGAIDLNSIPIGLVERVDIVTGGASAAYGSDAVGGVINIIMAKKRDGVRLSAQYGNTTGGDGSDYRIDASYGVSFADDRAHLLVGGNHNDTNAIGPRRDFESQRWSYMINPGMGQPGEPVLLLARDVNSVVHTTGGSIFACIPGNPGPPPPGCGGLFLNTFDADGTNRPIALGDQFNSFGQTNGGDEQLRNVDYYASLRPPLIRDNLFGRFVYELSDTLRFKADAYYSGTDFDSDYAPATAEFFIAADNAFLPAGAQTAMTNANLAGLLMGRNLEEAPYQHNHLTIDNTQGSLGLEGEFGQGWSWDAFYSYGESKLNLDLSNVLYSDRLNDAVDSILVGGVPVCRSGAAGCVPLNPFGPGNISQAAQDYILASTGQTNRFTQHEGAITLRGTPFSTWAGDVSIATGGEWRRQAITIASKAPAEALLNSPAFDDLRGSDTVVEGFLETLVPLAKDLPLIKSLEANGAIRRSKYDTAGGKTSWKLGASNDITETLRVRFTRSQDIRAPNLGELFEAPTAVRMDIIDPLINGVYEVLIRGGGNQNLKPERGLTTTFGVVYRPTWVRNLDLSLDFFKIHVDDKISGATGQDVVTRCVNGNTALCDAVIRDGTTGLITEIQSSIFNFAEVVYKGADFEAAHSLDLGNLMPALRGQLRTRLFVSYVEENSRFDGVVRIDDTGSALGRPSWRARLDERYEIGNLSLTARARYVQGVIRTSEFGGSGLADNYIPHQTYFDVGAEYRTSFLGEMSIYGNIVNVADREAPKNPESAFYDVLGRTFNVGVRVSL